MTTGLGSLASLHRYPVKSMMGEDLNAAHVTPRGLFGDRSYALCDTETGKVVSAKNPRKWPNLFSYRAAYTSPPAAGSAVPSGARDASRRRLRRQLQPGLRAGAFRDAGPAGYAAGDAAAACPARGILAGHGGTGQSRCGHRRSHARRGRFSISPSCTCSPPARSTACAKLNPRSRFEPRRFRPNLIIDTGGQEGFVENDWVGKTIAIGPEVRIQVTGPCPRCVMTTLPQADLPKDPGILKTAAQHNEARVGVYASVVQTGTDSHW